MLQIVSNSNGVNSNRFARVIFIVVVKFQTPTE